MIKTLTKIFAFTAVTKSLLETKKANLQELHKFTQVKFQAGLYS